ncbi:MAG: hypothetical protein JST86_01405 [Bacteroidetes bacterium]|nr:hypothetical protein [Bacteroidota bacterium]
MKAIFIWACLCLLVHTAVTAQMKRVVVKMSSKVRTAPVQNNFSPNNISSCTVDTIILTSQAQIDNFTTDYPACTTPKYLFIDGTGASPAITNLDGLSSLTEIINKLKISHTSIVNVSALNNITFIGDTLEIDHNPLLTGLGLNNLDSLGALILTALPLCTDISGLSNNITATGSINIDSTAITNLSGLSGIVNITNGGFLGLRIAHTPVTSLNSFANLNSIAGYMLLEGNPDLSSIDMNSLTSAYGFLFSDMPNLVTISGLTTNFPNAGIGTFWMINTGITNLTGMEGVTSATNFYLWSNPNLTSLQGLQNLSGNIGGGISIHDNPLLNDVSALSNITTINDGTLEFDSNPALINLAGVGNITTIGRGLWITNNSNLPSLADLNANLVIQNNGNTDSVRITDNNQLALCSFTPLCNYLNIDGRADIENNATGCSSIAEILASCASSCTAPPASVWNGTNSSNWDDADNWTPSGVPGFCTKVTIPASWNVNNYPVANSNITIGGLIMESGAELDLSGNALNITKTLQLDGANIYSATNVIATRVYAPDVANTTIEGNFTCQDFGGLSTFQFNNFNGDVVFSDSTGRTAQCSVFLNQFYGNLNFICNSDFGNMYLSNASPGYDYVQGNLTVTNNSSADISVGLGGDRPLKVQGDFIVDASNGHVDINNLTFVGGTFNPHTTQLGSNRIKINNLFMENGAETRLDQTVEINNSLVFDNGSNKINTTASNLLILNNGATVTRDPLNNRGFINGPMKKIGNEAFTFPVGKYEFQYGGDNYGPISISAPANSTDEFTAEYFHHSAGNDGYDTSLYSPGFGGISGKEYWTLQRDNGNTDVNVTLSYDSARSGVAYLADAMQVAGWNGSLWKSWGNGGYNGNVASGTLLSGVPLTGYGPLTLSFKPFRKPVITIGNVDSIPCGNNFISVPFSLDTAMIAGNTFKVELSDSLGVFSSSFNPVLGTKATITSDTITAFISSGLNMGSHYKIRVVGNLPGDTSVNTKTIIPHSTPLQTFNIIGPAPACLGVGVQKYYPSIHEPGVTYNWILSGGGSFTTNGDTAMVSWASTGFYSLTCTSANYCGNGPQKFLSVEVKPAAPTATPTVNNSGRWLFASQLPANASYQWYRNGGVISGANNSTYYASLAGDYTVRFTNYCGNSPASNIISFAANALPQTITFPAMPTKTYGDAPFVPNATASSGLPVAFTVVSGPAVINAQTNILTITGTGPVTVKASQPGDNLYDTAAPVTQTFAVNKAPQTITFTAIPAQNFGNPPIILSATATSGLPVSYAIVSGPATLSGNTATLTGLGTVTVSAAQSGDTNYLPATAVNNSFCVSVSALSTISGYTNLCPGTATYTVNDIPGATYLWRIAGGGTLPSTTSTATVNWSTPGLYALIVSASGSCGAASGNDTLMVEVINSIQPDSVISMLPADGAINQQLPLALSWVPAHPNNFYTFDVYIWPANQVQPSTPYVAGLTSVNYTVPVSSGLLANQAYKWMVVAHNGSCTQINTGPIQQFTLIPLPDLIVQNVQAPATAFSGQTIAVNWTVKNNGPGNTSTNQSWTDAVFLSFDTIPNFNIVPETSPAAWSQLQFPIKPLLIGTKQNVSALNNGQQYSNSINFTLPLSYSQPLYAYVITNYQAGTNAPQEVTLQNDTARAPQAIAVTLSPTPDLRVDTVFIPNSTFSGSTINVTYKVKNYGALTPPGVSWKDKIYISQSPIFNISTAIPLQLPKANGTYYANADEAESVNSTQLATDSSYTKSIQVVVPNFIFGQWFIYVFTNYNSSLYEGALANNNVNNNQLQVFLTPTPHLTVSSLTLPLTVASTTQQIGVNWNINNAGFNDNIEKNKGHYFVPNGSCTLPGPLGTGLAIRDSVGFGSSYWVDRVYLSTDASGLNIANAVQVSETVHGISGSGLYADFGPFPALCQPPGTDPSQFNVNTQPVILPAANYPANNGFVIPDDIVPGNYYVYVLANAMHNVYEYPGTPETRRSTLPITIQRPDVVVSAISVPSTAVGGQSIPVSYSILNNGPGAVYNHIRRDKIYMSTSPVFDISAQLISTEVFTENLPVNTPTPHTLNYTFPVSTSGTRYFYVQTNFDSAFKETNSNNNISAAAVTTVSTAVANDLVVSGVQVADTIFSIYPGLIKYTVQNNGTGTTAGVWKDSIFISCNSTFNAATSYFIATRNHSEQITNGQSYMDSFYVNIPFSYTINNCFLPTAVNTAYFFVKTNADNVVFEGSNGNNNITGSGIRTLINPLVDHIVTTVTAPDTATVGRPYPVNWSVKNIGYNPGQFNYGVNGLWSDGVYFSTDSVFNSNAVFASDFSESTVLNTNQSYSDSKNATPPNIPTGDYYVLVKTNYNGMITAEKVLDNNTNLVRTAGGAAKKIHVIQPLLPDLTDSIITAPALIATGQPLTAIATVSNKGAGDTYPANWSDQLWLSQDFIPGNSGDILLSATSHNGTLQPNQSYNDTTVANIPLNIVPGNYVLISRTNSTGNVFESNSNNNLGFKYITVYSPAPSDLIVQNVVTPDTVLLGYTIDTAQWVVKNISSNTAAGVSADGIYLSNSNTLDSTAILLGIKNKTINIGPLSADTVRMVPLVLGATEGNYHVIVKTDLLNNIVETNKDNNTGVAALPIYVKVKELPMNVLTPNTLYNTPRFYKLVIPDSLNGATILLTLKSGDSLTMKNQLFVGKEYVPTAAHFDYAYNNPNYGNQQITMASVTAGTYYIMARCVASQPVVQNISLLAERLPFAILSVQSSSGGNIGNVTVKISGSLFTNDMTAKLSNGTTTITASAVYFTNSTQVFATFNLQGRPLGIYDLSLIKTDLSIAVLPASFSIVNGNNGGVLTGGGNNTGQSGSGGQPGCDPGTPGGLNSLLVTEIVAPAKVFVGWPFVIQINYNNPANFDIPVQTRTLFNDKNVTMALTQAGLANGTTTLYLELSENGGPPGIIRAGGSGTITIYAKTPPNTPGHTHINFTLK